MAADRKEGLYEELKPLLRQPKIERDGSITSFCPVHEGDGRHKRRSLRLSPVHGLTCWAGCEFTAILDAFGVERRRTERPQPLRSPERQHQEQVWKPLGDPVAVYQYRDTNGRLVAEKARFEPDGAKKQFRFRVSPCAPWGSLAPLSEAELPLYGAELLATSSPDTPVYYVEGEKAVDACRTVGLLAVTHVGGAGFDDFSDGFFEPLRGRVVRLWPDNDEAGRRCMARIAARLRGTARSIGYVVMPLPLPEKGDAADYFGPSVGGSVAALEAGNLDAPATEYLAHDAIRVRIPSPLGVVAFTFSEIERLARAFEAELTVRVEGTAGEPYSQRLNLLSSSQQGDLRRSLEQVHGKSSANWTALCNTAIARAREGFLGQEIAQRIDAIPEPGEQEFLVETLVPKGAATVIFADGASGKTWISLGLAIGVSTGLAFCDLRCESGPVLFVDYETDARTFRRRVGRLFRGLGWDEVPPAGIFYWSGRGIPLVDQVERLRRFVEQEGVSLVIVDSAAAACGGKPEEAEVALRYFSALQRLGPVTTLTVAHVNKGGDREKALGSAFWHNQPRRTWSVDRADEEDSPVVDLALICKKVNDGRKPKPFGLRLRFTDPNGPVSIEPMDIRQNQELQSHRPLKHQIWDVLMKPMSAEEIGAAIGHDEVKLGSISATLRKHRGQLWTTVSEGAQSGRGNSARWARLARG